MSGNSPTSRLSEEAVDAMAGRAFSDPLKLATLAATAFDHGHLAKAYEIARAATALAPDDAEVASLVRAPTAAGVPPWHFGIVRDVARNDAYDAALRRAVRPGARVLDIGAGTGLLAMMAARAGASAVVSCEMNKPLADVASEIVERNGYSDRVTVLAKHSSEIDAQADMGWRADVLVSEIVSNDILGQSVLPVIEDAAARLLKPGAKMIPSAARIRVALAHWSGLDERLPAEAAGFDIRPLHRLRAIPHRVSRGDQRLSMRSEPADLFRFDFSSGGPFMPQRAVRTLVSAGGPVNGIVQWIQLQLDELTEYENQPAPDDTSCWACLFYPLSQELAGSTARTVSVHAFHNRHRLRIWGEAAAAQPAQDL